MVKRFSASSAAQLMQCHGSANLELAIPGYKEPVKDEMAGAKGVGTRMHDSFKAFTHWTSLVLCDLSGLVYQYSRLHWKKRRAYLADVSDSEAAAWFQGVMPFVPPVLQEQYIEWLVALDKDEHLPPKMLVYVVEAIEYFNDLRRSRTIRDRARQIHAERSLVCDWLPSSPSTTPDVVIITEDTIDVLDWKTGAIPVDPYNNDQLMFYLASALHANVPRSEWQNLEMRVHIVQPGNQREAYVRYDELMNWMQDAVQADRDIMQKDLTLRPGDHCTFCPANPHSRGDKSAPWCPAMYELLYPDTTNNDEILDL